MALFVATLKIHSWRVKRDQLDVTCFIISLFNARHVSDVNTSIIRSLRLICWAISWVVLFWFDVCWCYVVVWLGWCGIRSALVLQPAYGYHTNPPHIKLTTLPPSFAVVMKSGNLNFLATSGSLQACNRTDLHFLLCILKFRLQNLLY